jgi:succinate dehydrogenase / fumarate reductase cytochrome b subunit
MWSSSIGMKIVMAVTGVVLVLFVIGHMLGNLEIWAGADAINEYGRRLRFIPPLLWVIRLGLLTLVTLHIVAGVRLTFLNRAARPVAYARRQNVATGIAARTMIWTGVLLFGFVIYHLMHFTFRSIDPTYKTMEDSVHGGQDVFRMVVDAFQRKGVALFYVVAMLFLGLHVSHGAASMFQTLGLTHPRYTSMWKRLGPIVALIVVLGFVSVPLGVLLGIIHPHAGGS